MTQYDIEFRFRDEAQSYVKQLMYHLEAKFHLGLFTDPHPISHVALAGPFMTRTENPNDEKKLVTDFITLCAKTPLCSYEINSYAFSDTTRSVCIRIDPGQDMLAFEINLLQALAPFNTQEKKESTEPYVFHATIARNVNLQKYGLIKKHAEQIKPLHFKHYVIRITVTKENKFLCEYDFLTRSVLTQKEALDKKLEFTDRSLYHQFLNKKYNPDDRLTEKPVIPDEIFARPVWTKITDSLKKI
jgi:2'-5' RNA ligase